MTVVLRAEDYEYIAEGSAHLIAAYHGPESSVLTGKVLRIALEDSAEAGDSEEQFIRSVMMPLVGGKYADPGTPVPCTREFLEALEKRVEPVRKHGKVAHAIDKERPSVLLKKNFSASFGAGSWCLELKPKYYLTARSRLLPPELSEKYRTAFFEMLFDRGAVGAYNPADLLSGDRVRIARAVRELWENGHKWLKVFKDGKAFSSRADIEAQIPSAILLEEGILAMEMNKELSDNIQNIQTKEYVDSYGAKLILDELLRRFNSDRGAIEEKLWNMYMNPEAMTSLPWELVAYETSAQANEQSSNESFTKAKEGLSELDDQTLLGFIAEYMIAAVAKDLSIMICLKQDETGAWQRSVNVVDLGVKGLDKVDEWFTRDSELTRKFKT
ncbi:hypothetical protein NDN08_004161 [Rhodosorus marinus]|uniref:Inositol-pentakisphosphate 2-kinase n=1 Tax=Rhodosorus marinus TaxID=101924 RepID=A0AAV8UIV6_9RHOD|nr:hypothetical protein NDN08_004161 [Rhodosorus marinus]